MMENEEKCEDADTIGEKRQDVDDEKAGADVAKENIFRNLLTALS